MHPIASGCVAFVLPLAKARARSWSKWDRPSAPKTTNSPSSRARRAGRARLASATSGKTLVTSFRLL